MNTSAAKAAEEFEAANPQSGTATADDGPRPISTPAREYAVAHGDFADWSSEELQTYADRGGIQ
ncbi:hypothetical protein [Streptomyces sp. WZ-12]|uniref:hypothetical protein n=1 Tax=Streptomyces sp. WZ-12 TaxID=3030210 RepID=UPI0023811AFF|nr:hypothetical protein [Streptomyces sp. WZ-12]